MPPSRGAGSTEDSGAAQVAPSGPSAQQNATTTCGELTDEALASARKSLRALLANLHVLDVLPDRSRILAVDADLPVHSVISAVLREQHMQPPSQRLAQGLPGGRQKSSAGETPSAANLDAVPLLDAQRREAAVGETPAKLSCGCVPPSQPSNVLAEVCEFDAGVPAKEATKAEEEAADDARVSSFRRWTSPDDGWGTQLSSIPMQDLEKMPMGMPVTVGEIADFLAYACESTPGEEAQAKPAAESSGAAAEEGSQDALDWSLAQWRAHRLKMAGEKDKQAQDSGQTLEQPVEGTSRLYVEERPCAAGPVLVHRVALAPPRPILCTDDPEASLLKAVKLMLAYPELDALPIVSPIRCAVVAHLTLGYCLAFMLSRLRGSDLMPLVNLAVKANGADAGDMPQRIFEAAASGGSSGRCWAEPRTPPVQQQMWVLRRSQPIRDLLAFFASMPQSGVPIVEDNGDAGGGVLGLLTRRDLLHFLDLAMQSSRRKEEREDELADVADEVKEEAQEEVSFNAGDPIEVMVDTLRRYPQPGIPEGQAAGGAAAQTAGEQSSKAAAGVELVYEEEASLRSLILHVLGARNRKAFFVQGSPTDERAPRLRRIISVSDVWRLLVGVDPELLDDIDEDPGSTTAGTAEDGEVTVSDVTD